MAQGARLPQLPRARRLMYSVDTSTSLRILLLGGFRVLTKDQAVPEHAWRLRKSRALIALLALAPGHRLRRAELAALLWPELGPDAAANNLRAALHGARRALLPDTAADQETAEWIAADREYVWLAQEAGLTVDVSLFEALARDAAASDDPALSWRAVGLYGGDLLAGEPYQDLVEPRRIALRERYLALLRYAAALHERRSEPERAIEALRQVTEAEPVDEEASAALMRLYATTGDRHRAVRQYQLLRDALRRELDAEPEPATTVLCRQILEWRFTWNHPAHAFGRGRPADVRQDDGPLLTTVAVGPGPCPLAVHAAGRLLYVGHSGGREVWALDLDTLERRARTETNSYPHGLAVNPATERLYATNYPTGRVSMLDARTCAWVDRVVVGPPKHPRGIAVDPCANRVYVTTRRNAPADDASADALLILDGASLEVIATLSVGNMPMGVVVHPDAGRVYVASYWDGTVSVVDARRMAVIDTVRVGAEPWLMALNERTGHLYVTNQRDSSVSVVHAESRSFVATVRVGALPYGVAVDPAARRVYVTSAQDETLSVIDTALHEVVATLPAGPFPTEVVLSPEGDRAFVANARADTLTVLALRATLPGRLDRAAAPSLARV